MHIELKFIASDAADLGAIIAMLDGAKVAFKAPAAQAAIAAPADTPAPVVEDKPKRAPRTAKPVEEAPAAPVQAEAEPAEAATEPQTETASAVTLDYAKDIAPKALALAKSGGRDALVAVLEQFGVDHASKIAASDYAAFLAAVEEALAQ